MDINTETVAGIASGYDRIWRLDPGITCVASTPRVLGLPANPAIFLHGRGARDAKANQDAPIRALQDEGPSVSDPYVCIAVQSSTQCKHWNSPDGWRGVVSFFRDAGYRVISIHQKPVGGSGIVWTHIPYGTEDEIGDRPLAEWARWMRHAAAFVGLTSSLSWLAWATGAPVVMISGFARPTNELTTPYRVINWHAWNCYWNDVWKRFDHKEFLWCPGHAGTSLQFECTRLITSENVIATIEGIPGVKG